MPELRINFILFLLAAYVVVGRLVLVCMKPPVRAWAFAGLNLVGAFLLCRIYAPFEISERLSVALLATYIAIVLFNYVLLVYSERTKRISSAFPLIVPIGFMIAIRSLPASMTPFAHQLTRVHQYDLTFGFLGISYMMFRLTHLAQEVQNGVAELPSVGDYLSFAFFAPTLVLGPINPYSLFASSMANVGSRKPPIFRCLVRILLGLVKFLFFATILNHFTYQGLMLDGHAHSSLDFFISAAAFPLFLYCNFSGFCDMAIGVSGLMGIEVMENFDRPFEARNLQEFWTRWHISLTNWFRDLIFTPMSKSLARRLGAKAINHAMSISILVSFILIGIWHGAGLNFVLFGIGQGVGVATVFYWSVFLKRRMGAKRYAALREISWLKIVGSVATFVYFAATLVFFANSMQDLGRVLSAIR